MTCPHDWLAAQNVHFWKKSSWKPKINIDREIDINICMDMCMDGCMYAGNLRIINNNTI